MKNKLINAFNYVKAKRFTTSIFFTLAVVLLGGITYIPLPCPVCEGKGYVTGAGDLKVTDIEYDLIYHYVVGLECGWDYEKYTYDFTVTVENPTPSPLYGMLQLTFHDPEASKTRIIEEEDEEIEVTDVGNIIAAETIFVEELAAGDKRTIEETIVFDALTLELFDVKIHQVFINPEEEFRCPFHDESNKVTLTEWLKLR